jgi:hypothetical protein
LNPKTFLRRKKMENQVALEKENSAGVVYLAFELSHKRWKLGFSDGKAPQIREVSIDAADLEALRQEIEKSKRRFKLPETARVVSCYEAGREGFWLDRALEGMGIENMVVDASSIEVNRRQRRAKTDRMDVKKLVRQLVRYWRGERDVWSVVRVPSPEAEDSRQLHRGLEVLKEERKQHRVRIQSLLYTQGIDMKVLAKQTDSRILSKGARRSSRHFQVGAGARRPRGGLIPDLVDGVACSNWVARRVSAHIASGVPDRFRARIEGGRAQACHFTTRPTMKMDARFNNKEAAIAATFLE